MFVKPFPPKRLVLALKMHCRNNNYYTILFQFNQPSKLTVYTSYCSTFG